MASDKLDIIIAQQHAQGAQLATILGVVGEHGADIRGLREGLVRVENRLDVAVAAKTKIDDAAVEADVMAVARGGRVSAKLMVLIISAIATAVATALGAVLN